MTRKNHTRPLGERLTRAEIEFIDFLEAQNEAPSDEDIYASLGTSKSQRNALSRKETFNELYN